MTRKITKQDKLRSAEYELARAGEAFDTICDEAYNDMAYDKTYDIDAHMAEIRYQKAYDAVMALRNRRQ